MHYGEMATKYSSLKLKFLWEVPTMQTLAAKNKIAPVKQYYLLSKCVQKPYSPILFFRSNNTQLTWQPFLRPIRKATKNNRVAFSRPCFLWVSRKYRSTSWLVGAFCMGQSKHSSFCLSQSEVQIQTTAWLFLRLIYLLTAQKYHRAMRNAMSLEGASAILASLLSKQIIYSTI